MSARRRPDVRPPLASSGATVVAVVAAVVVGAIVVVVAAGAVVVVGGCADAGDVPAERGQREHDHDQRQPDDDPRIGDARPPRRATASGYRSISPVRCELPPLACTRSALGHVASRRGRRAAYGRPAMDIAHIDWIPEGTRFGIDEMTYFVGRGERDLDERPRRRRPDHHRPPRVGRLPGRAAALRRRQADQAAAVRLHRHLDQPGHPALGADRPTRALHRGPAPACGARRQPRPTRRPHPRSTRGVRPPRRRRARRPALAGRRRRRATRHLRLPARAHNDRRPMHDWDRLGDALRRAGALGIDEYERVRDDLIERVIDAKLRRLATIDPASCTVAEWNSATHLDVMSMHDTMNHTARPDGAVCLERQPEDRLPAVVALSNHGDATGEHRPERRRHVCGTPRRCHRCDPTGSAPSGAPTRWPSTPGVPTTSPTTAPTRAATRPAPSDPKLRTLEPLAVVRPRDGITRRLRLGVWQNEFLREFLLGPETAADARAARHRLAPATRRPGRLARRAPAPRPRPRPQLGPRPHRLNDLRRPGRSDRQHLPAGAASPREVGGGRGSCHPAHHGGPGNPSSPLRGPTLRGRRGQHPDAPRRRRAPPPHGAHVPASG